MMSWKMPLVQAKDELKQIFSVGVDSAKAQKIIKTKIKVEKNNLNILDEKYPLRSNIYMIGFGKGVLGMSIAMGELLGDRLIKGIISIPRGAIRQYLKTECIDVFSTHTGAISYQENSIDNQPDDDTLITTRDIIDMVKSLGENDTLIVLISGGGSALLSMPHPTISVKEKIDLCKKLFNLGANIKEINKIRQKLSIVKAGGLARMAYPAFVIALILSDIIGDPVELIASGPTVYSPKTSEEIVRILKKYNVLDEIDGDLKKILLSKEICSDRSLLNNQMLFNHVQNIIIGNNSLALEAIRLECLRKNLIPIILFNDVQGIVSDVSAMYGKICRLFCQILLKSLSSDDFNILLKTDTHLSVLTQRSDEIYNIVKISDGQSLILISGGEPSVMVNGTGKGGRNQELALRFSLDWYEIIKNNPELCTFNVVLLSAGTDGQDGPTDAAGAFGYSQINSTMLNLCEVTNNQYKGETSEFNNVTAINTIECMIPKNVLNNNDSYTFYSRFKNGEDLLKTGITGTNVMDLHLIYIKRLIH